MPTLALEINQEHSTSRLMNKLVAPFDPRDIEHRVLRKGLKKNGDPWAMVLAYVTNRAIQRRFDNVFGCNGWKNEFRYEARKEYRNLDVDKALYLEGGHLVPKRKRGRNDDSVLTVRVEEEVVDVLCGISVWDGAIGEWVTKWDGGPQSDFEATKGGLSGAQKRAAVEWGVGRYLYDLEESFAVCTKKKTDYCTHRDTIYKDGEWVAFWWGPPALPEWAQPTEWSDAGYPKKKEEAPVVSEKKKEEAENFELDGGAKGPEEILPWEQPPPPKDGEIPQAGDDGYATRRQMGYLWGLMKKKKYAENPITTKAQAWVDEGREKKESGHPAGTKLDAPVLSEAEFERLKDFLDACPLKET